MSAAYRGHKAGSRKGKVHQCFDTKGEAAAIALGDELELADSTVRSWLKTWAKQSGTQLSVKPPREPKAPKPAKRGKVISPDTPRVFHVGDRDRLGVIVTKGEQVSLVRWEDGYEGYINNDHLRTSKPG